MNHDLNHDLNQDLNRDLFDQAGYNPIGICEDMWLLKRFADEGELQRALKVVVAAAPLRHWSTPGGRRMSVAMTNCGDVGWVSDSKGYRYQDTDPHSGKPWPALPAVMAELADKAANAAGFGAFRPDVCLLNCYSPGSQMTAHQDRDEADFSHPIVSVSLGLPARFFVQGPERRGKSRFADVVSGDVIVWGGASRLHYHGVRPLKPGVHPVFGEARYNLTFRRAMA